MRKLTFISLLIIICTILRAVIFNQRGEKAWKSLIPFYNKYVLGKLCDSKKLGIITMVFSCLTYVITMISYSVELMMLSLIPSDTEFSMTKIKEYIPNNLMTLNDTTKIMMIIFGVVFLFSWSLMMRKFSEKNNANTWWILGWAICPVVSYAYFCFIHPYFYTIDKNLVVYNTKTVTTSLVNEKVDNTDNKLVEKPKNKKTNKKAKKKGRKK